MANNYLNKTVEVICPLYNGENYIINLNNSLLKQKKVNIDKITYILTETNDNSERILKNIKANYIKIKPNAFSHSKTREDSAFKSNADIIVFISQDVVIEDELWCYYLTKDIKNDVAACYSRQITKYNNIEKYTRECNYPVNESIVSKEDIPNLGLKTFFFSDASCAINRKIFVELNGYDGKYLPISEDMYFAYKLINKSYKIKYASKSVVYHSHKFTIKQVYDRYKLTGKFFKENSYLSNYGTNSSGWTLAKYVLKRAIQEKNIKVLIRWFPDMAARFIGMKAGKL